MDTPMNPPALFNQDDLISVLKLCHNSLMNAYHQQALLHEELLSVGELAKLTCDYLTNLTQQHSMI